MNAGHRFPHRTLVHAATVVDADGVDASPGAILFEEGATGTADATSTTVRIIACGTPQKLGQVSAARERSATGAAEDATATSVVRLDGWTVMPALANAHAHLDLSHIGPRPFTEIAPGLDRGGTSADFTAWGAFVMRRRATTDAAIAESVDRGIALSRAGGVAAVGDIAGAWSTVPGRRQRAAGLAGVSFVEVFGLGARQAAAIDRMAAIASGRHDGGASGGDAIREVVATGLQPHAPYSCGAAVFAGAADLSEATGVRLSTHLAETLEEIEFAERGTGPFADFLRSMGRSEDDLIPLGAHPLDALASALARGRWLVAHLNYLSEAHIGLLAAMPVDVAYCPRSSAYFGHPRAGRPPHAYRAMLDAGVNVALGTDSLICLDTPDRISTLDEMRFLRRRDGTAARRLLRMATINGARALGLDETLFTLAPGAVAGLIALEGATLDDVLAGSGGPRWVAGQPG